MRLDIRILLPVLPLAVLACGGTGGPSDETPSGGNNPVPGTSESYRPLSGVASVSAGSGTLRIEWMDTPAPPGFEMALFRSTTRGTVYDGPPEAEGLSGTSHTITGLPTDTLQYVGMGLRPLGGAGAYTPTGTILGGLPADPIYVDSTASSMGADGTTPGTAFPDVLTALLTAFANGGGTVWVRGGNYPISQVPLFAGVHVYGGFDASFLLANRDPVANPTNWNVAAGQRGIDVRGGGPEAVLDGINLLGGGVAQFGIDVEDTDVEFRSMQVNDFMDRGIRLRNSQDVDTFDVHLAHVQASRNGGDGVSALGAFDLFIDGCRFETNVQEGLDLDDLVAPEGTQSTLSITGSLFFGNGTEGLDADLSAPLVPGPGGGRFLVMIRGCFFERNGLDGALIDLEYELIPPCNQDPCWFADITIRDSYARGNREAGFHLDVDAPADVLLHEVRSTSNSAEGILITSESDPGIVVVSSSVVMGNLGPGMRSTFGNRNVIATHCVFAGNQGGGLVSSPAESAAVSSVAHLQPTPWQGARSVASVVETDPMSPFFTQAPEEYLRVNGEDSGMLTLAQVAGFAGNAVLELTDDGMARSANQINGTSVTVTPAPMNFRPPSALFAFAPGSGVSEDFTLIMGSPAIGAGLAAPGAPLVDAGAMGGPVIDGDPGFAEPLPSDLFRVAATEPPPTTVLGPTQSLEVRFSADLNPGSVVTDQVRAVRNGTEIPITFQTMGDTITIDPTSGWGAGPFEIELHRNLMDTSGNTLATPLALPLTSM